MNINIVCVGKLKESYWREAVGEYLKRIGAYASIKIAELPESRLSDRPSEREIASALETEAKLMLPFIEQRSAYNIAMCIEGSLLSSAELASKLDSATISGFSTINFIIGSSFGLAQSIKQAAHLKLSISKMTFPHQLARVVLAEQIYRALSINNNSKYHK